MLAIMHSLGMIVADLFKSRCRLEAENLFLRRQLNIALRRAPARPRLCGSDRALLVWTTRPWPSLLGAAQVVQPETILRLRNHAQAIAAIDLCVVPTLTFDRMFAFLVLGHGRRQLLWFEVTRYPTAEWLARQITEAFPWTSAPAYLVRDNDRAYGQVFTSRMRAMGIRDQPVSPGSPWQNGFAERLIGTVRRECLDRILIFGEAHLRQILSLYAYYYNESRAHLSLRKDTPRGRAVQRYGTTMATPVLSGAASSLCPDMIFGKDRSTLTGTRGTGAIGPRLSRLALPCPRPRRHRHSPLPERVSQKTLIFRCLKRGAERGVLSGLSLQGIFGGHVWTAPALQGESSVRLSGRVQVMCPACIAATCRWP
jgi:transposase InsO family protein